MRVLGRAFIWVCMLGVGQPAVAEQPAEGAVAGVVVDSFGDAVAGVDVAIVSIAGYRLAQRVTPDGAFDFNPVVAGRYRLLATREGFQPVELSVDVVASGTARLRVVLEAVSPAALVVTVRDSQGLVLPGVVVEAFGPAGAVLVDVTSEDGVLVFPSVRGGAWRVRGTLEGFDPDEAVAVARFGVSADVELSLGLDYSVSESVVVVGSRRTVGRRAVSDSAVPVQIVSGDVLASQPRGDLAEVMRALTPSFNVNTQPISDAATVVRPVNFRNLAPDHLLVLVNGKRRHRSAVIAWLGNGISDGSQGPNLSVIPAIAVRQAELLRDGAAAQYGSDAIGGVVNFQLKDAREGGSLVFRSGVHRDRNVGDEGTCGARADVQPGPSCAGVGGRAPGYSLAGNIGLPLGNAGFANVSLETGWQAPTNRAVQRADALGLVAAGGPSPRDTAQVWGQPEVGGDIKLFGNFGTTLASGRQPYLHANYARRRVTGGFYYRHPHTRGGVFRGPLVDGVPSLLVGDRRWAATGIPGAAGCPSVPVVDYRPAAAALAAVEANPDCFTLYSRFPGGFTPQFGGVLRDHSVVAGLRSVRPNGFTWDVSAGIGESRIDQFISDTVNASLGYDTPTSFRPGGYQQSDVNVNLDVAVPVSDRLHVAAGLEYRVERFTIFPGDEPSWAIGPYAAQGFSSGSNGFNGYRPDTTSGTWGRGNGAVYGDVELGGSESSWSLGGALRLERFSGFGNTLNGKVSVRRRVATSVALRGAVSTGFRAPTPGQVNTFNVTTAFIDGELLNNGVVPATSGIALARGGRPLQPETSVNFSGGLIAGRGPVEVTADWFRIDVEDRLALTQEIRLGPDEIEVLLSEGILEARNFPIRLGPYDEIVRDSRFCRRGFSRAS